MKLTGEEERAIASLKILALRWPRSLSLFSWAGMSLRLKPKKGRSMSKAVVTYVHGIPNDGGNPNQKDPSL